MAYYSFIVFAPQLVTIPEYRVLLDTGRNVFTLATDNLDGFLEALKTEGVKVIQTNKLDDFDEVTTADLPLLLGERT